MGRKYIIELEEIPFTNGFTTKDGDVLYRVKGFNSLVFDREGLNKLLPYEQTNGLMGMYRGTEINVGDEIYRKDDDDSNYKCVVLDIDDDDMLLCLSENGIVERIDLEKTNWQKTGKHFKEIDSVIKQLQRKAWIEF